MDEKSFWWVALLALMVVAPVACWVWERLSRGAQLDWFFPIGALVFVVGLLLLCAEALKEKEAK